VGIENEGGVSGYILDVRWVMIIFLFVAYFVSVHMLPIGIYLITFDQTSTISAFLITHDPICMKTVFLITFLRCFDYPRSNELEVE